MTLRPLVGRDEEFAILRGHWRAADSGVPQLVVVYGRRRVGKTFLLLHLLERLRADGIATLYFAATQQAEHVELARLLDAVRDDLGSDVADLAGGSFVSWESALRFLVATARSRPLAVVFDEVPYLVKSTPGFASIVQAVWDRTVAAATPAPLLLVLTGSAVGVMESLLGARGALHRRATRQMRLDPFDLPTATRFLDSPDPVTAIEAYAACGGYPLHLAAWEPRRSTAANLLALAGTPGALLLEDGEGMLEELPDIGGVRRVLTAVGQGQTRHSEISNATTQRVDGPLSMLQRMGLVRRITPIGAPGRSGPQYEIPDPYLRFWFAVPHADRQLIEGGQGAAALARSRERWQRHLGWVFEEMARDHCRRLVAGGTLPGDLAIGRWWTVTGQPCEVDVLGLAGSRTALIGEAKWSNRPVGASDANALRAKLDRVPDPLPDPLVAVWSRGGVAPAVRDTGILSFGPPDMVA